MVTLLLLYATCETPPSTTKLINSALDDADDYEANPRAGLRHAIRY